MSDTLIRITTDTDSILFSGDDLASGWIYNDKSLDSWYSTPDVSVDTNARPNAHGDYSPDQTYTEAARPALEGQYFGVDRIAAGVARNRLSGLYNDGKQVRIDVTDPIVGVTSRNAFITNVDVPWTPHKQLTFAIDAYCPDPRRYGPLTTLGPVALPSPSSGLVWPLGTAASGRFWEWGTIANLGQLTYTNLGNTPAYLTFQVGSGGRFFSGFQIVEVETGRVLSYAAATNTNDVVTLNNRTRRAQLNGSGDASGPLVIRQWMSVPPGATRHYQLATLGTVGGTPTLSATVATPFL
jgi:hypothetical protein